MKISTSKFLKKVCSIFLATIMSANIFYVASAKDFSLTIFHTNDSHGTVSHEPYLKTLVDTQKSAGQNVITISAGDIFHGQLIASLSKGSSIVKIMNAVGYDYIAPGNHDFNYELEGLLNLQAQANFKILAANITDKSNGKLIFKPYEIKEIDGVKIGIFGIATPETLVKTSGIVSVSKLNFKDPVEVSKNIVKELKDNGCKIIIAITHLGLDKSSEDKNRSDNLAENVDGIDLIIDGHSHTVLENGLKIGKTLIAQTGEHGKNIGVVNLELKDDLISESAYLINMEENMDIIPDENVLDVIENENEKVDELASQKVCDVDFDLDGERDHVRKNETNLTNLVTDAILNKTGADLVMINGGTIRTSLKKGAITKKDILQVLPFTNFIVTIKVKGSTILKALEHGVGEYPANFGGMAQIAGINFKFDPSQKKGERVFDVYFDKTNEKLDLEKEYVLATNQFMLDGGDGYDMFVDKKDYRQYNSIEEALMNYMTSNDISSYAKVKERKTIANKPNTVLENNSVDNNIYTVQKGDSLWKIAQKFKTTWQKLAKINSIKNPRLIYPGQVLKI